MARKWRRTRFVLFLGLFVLAFGANSYATKVTFNPSTSTVDVGKALTVDIVVEGLAVQDLAAFDFNIIYDSTLLYLSGYSLGTRLGIIDPSNPLADAQDLSRGSVGSGVFNVAELSYLADLSAQPDTFTLATVSFDALQPGTSPLTFSDVTLGDFWGDPLQNEASSGSVSAIPEASTILLVGAGVAGFYLYRRKRRNGN